MDYRYKSKVAMININISYYYECQPRRRPNIRLTTTNLCLMIFFFKIANIISLKFCELIQQTIQIKYMGNCERPAYNCNVDLVHNDLLTGVLTSRSANISYIYFIFMSLIVLYFLHSTSVLSFYIDVVLTLSKSIPIGTNSHTTSKLIAIGHLVLN